MKKAALYCLSPLLFWSASVSGQSKDAVIENYFKAIGGKEKWNSILTKIDSVTHFNLIKSELTANSADTVFIVTRFMRPNLQRTESSAMGRPVTALCFDGKVFWTRTGDRMPSIQPAEHAEYYKSTVMLGFGDLLVDESASVSYEGVGVLDGKKCSILIVKRKEWIYSSRYYFGIESGLLLCVASHGSGANRRTYLKDYRSVMGILWAYTEEFYVGDKLESISVHKRILLNVEIDKRVFSP